MKYIQRRGPPFRKPQVCMHSTGIESPHHFFHPNDIRQPLSIQPTDQSTNQAQVRRKEPGKEKRVASKQPIHVAHNLYLPPQILSLSLSLSIKKNPPKTSQPQSPTQPSRHSQSIQPGTLALTVQTIIRLRPFQARPRPIKRKRLATPHHERGRKRTTQRLRERRPRQTRSFQICRAALRPRFHIEIPIHIHIHLDSRRRRSGRDRR